ncbi:hypothetical protein B484DRAFT_355901 [Ochromonadaceae sp. CCMP2298]|nr:hypothetical protein B484DRAFT_355901 [Ochromonadaceae sp. CCMP2298]
MSMYIYICVPVSMYMSLFHYVSLSHYSYMPLISHLLSLSYFFRIFFSKF